MSSPAYASDLARIADAFPHWDRLAGSRLLITGATGLIGSYLADLLLHQRAAGLTVELVLVGRSRARLAARFGETAAHLVESSCGEGLDDAVAASDLVVHAASNATPSSIAADPVGTMAANLDYLSRLLVAAAGGARPRVVVVSSSEVYGRVDGDRPLTEDQLGWIDLLSPRSCYPSAKRAAETLAASHHAQYGVDVTIVRPGYIYGPTMTAGDDRVVPQFVRRALAGEPILLQSDGSAQRSYCYVGDCATGILTAALDGVAGRAYNIADPDGDIAIRRLADLVARNTGSGVVFANPEDAAEPRASSSRVVLDAGALIGLGWRAVTPLADGLATTVAVTRQGGPPRS